MAIFSLLECRRSQSVVLAQVREDSPLYLSSVRMLFAAAALIIPARRALRVDPLTALRAE